MPLELLYTSTNPSVIHNAFALLQKPLVETVIVGYGASRVGAREEGGSRYSGTACQLQDVSAPAHAISPILIFSVN